VEKEGMKGREVLVFATLACDQRLSLWSLALRGDGLGYKAKTATGHGAGAGAGAGATAGAGVGAGDGSELSLQYLGGVVVEVGDPAELVLDAVDPQLDRGVIRLAVVGEGLQRIDIET